MKVREEVIPLNRAGLALEEVWNKDLVFLLTAVGKNIGTLERLLKVAKDVVDNEDSLGGVSGAGNVCMVSLVSQSYAPSITGPFELGYIKRTGLVTTNVFVLALVLVALGYNGGQVAAGRGVAAGSRHSRHYGSVFNVFIALYSAQKALVSTRSRSLLTSA